MPSKTNKAGSRRRTRLAEDTTPAPSADSENAPLDHLDTPPTPDLVDLTEFQLPNESTPDDVIYNEGETPEVPAQPRPADLSVYGDLVSEDLRKQYEGDAFGKFKGNLYFDPASDGVPYEKKLLLKAKRRHKLCQKIMERARKADLSSVGLLEDTRLTSTGYQGVRRDKSQPIPSAFRLVHNLERPTIFRDQHGHRAVIYVPHNRSRDAQLQGLKTQVEALETAVPAAWTERGNFGVIPLQLHRDLGAKEPVYSQTYTRHKSAADQFLDSQPTRFYANYISGVLQTYLPAAHMRQSVVNRKIRKAHRLKPLFGVYPSVAINLHHAVTTRHKDHSNSTQLPCVVMPVENTDPSGSGQLVLEELGLIFAMNPGDIIISPQLYSPIGIYTLAKGLSAHP
ncbi:hypothetical protein FRC05_005645 [Tulasnella sp. 425]|nr:hypothetical protein FRC05_005645 [Tulasnella sp. 425]